MVGVPGRAAGLPNEPLGGAYGLRPGCKITLTKQHFRVRDDLWHPCLPCDASNAGPAAVSPSLRSRRSARTVPQLRPAYLTVSACSEGNCRRHDREFAVPGAV